jgi:hypothetical protein
MEPPAPGAANTGGDLEMTSPVERQPIGTRRRAATRLGRVIVLAAVGVVLASGAVTATAPTTWHRLNIYSDPPEHERFMCIAGDTWTCRYDKLPDPRLGLSWDQTRGTFTGSDATGSWVCPSWFPGDACDAADTVISGVSTFVFPRASGGFSVDQSLLVSDDGRLWISWEGGTPFVCPWEPSFATALVADESCTFAP